MNISLDSPNNLQQDDAWYLQGRIIPPSCSNGDGCILHMQTKHTSWAENHFHIGRSPITAEVGLEFVMSLLMPRHEKLLAYSLDPDEREGDIDYLAMVRLGHPKDAIAFLTVTGLTIVIQIKGLEAMFGSSEKCKDCSKSSNIIALPGLEVNPEGDFDSLMEIPKDERSH